jgi:hypothetical protein
MHPMRDWAVGPPRTSASSRRRCQEVCLTKQFSIAGCHYKNTSPCLTVPLIIRVAFFELVRDMPDRGAAIAEDCVQSSLIGVSSCASEAVNSQWMRCYADSQSSLVARPSPWHCKNS